MSIDCGKHQVIVLNGKDEDSLSLGECDNNISNPIHSSTEGVTIKFITLSLLKDFVSGTYNEEPGRGKNKPGRNKHKPGRGKHNPGRG